jgi:methylisocitrate lyase
MTLRDQLTSGELLRWPGAASPLVAMMIERAGFDGVYVSGAGLAAERGLTDTGILHENVVVTRSSQIACATTLPTVVDVDTGFDDPDELVRALWACRLSGCHIEDQIADKRCGHLDGKTLVPTGEMVTRIEAAARGRGDTDFVVIARTDARAVEGLDAAIERARAYVDAGADAIFPEALHDRSELERVRAALDVPLVVNMTEFGKTELMTTAELRDIGINAVIYPLTAMRLANRAIEDGLRVLRDHGTQVSLLERMQTRAELYDLLDYDPQK